MSIKEALERGAMERPRTPYTLGNSNERETMLAKADFLLQEAGIPEKLLELVEIIRPNFSDVRISERRTSFCEDGSAHTGLKWNFKDTLGDEGGYKYMRVDIRVLPIREEIVIGGEVLTRKQWEQQDIVDDAIIAAFRNPMTGVGLSGN